MIRLICAFLFGMREFRHAFTHYYPSQRECHAYDSGREFAHRITLRHYED